MNKNEKIVKVAVCVALFLVLMLLYMDTKLPLPALLVIAFVGVPVLYITQMQNAWDWVARHLSFEEWCKGISKRGILKVCKPDNEYVPVESRERVEFADFVKSTQDCGEPKVAVVYGPRHSGKKVLVRNVIPSVLTRAKAVVFGESGDAWLDGSSFSRSFGDKAAGELSSWHLWENRLPFVNRRKVYLVLHTAKSFADDDGRLLQLITDVKEWAVGGSINSLTVILVFDIATMSRFVKTQLEKNGISHFGIQFLSPDECYGFAKLLDDRGLLEPACGIVLNDGIRLEQGRMLRSHSKGMPSVLVDLLRPSLNGLAVSKVVSGWRSAFCSVGTGFNKSEENSLLKHYLALLYVLALLRTDDEDLDVDGLARLCGGVVDARLLKKFFHEYMGDAGCVEYRGSNFPMKVKASDFAGLLPTLPLMLSMGRSDKSEDHFSGELKQLLGRESMRRFLEARRRHVADVMSECVHGEWSLWMSEPVRMSSCLAIARMAFDGAALDFVRREIYAAFRLFLDDRVLFFEGHREHVSSVCLSICDSVRKEPIEVRIEVMSQIMPHLLSFVLLRPSSLAEIGFFRCFEEALGDECVRLDKSVVEKLCILRIYANAFCRGAAAEDGSSASSAMSLLARFGEMLSGDSCSFDRRFDKLFELVDNIIKVKGELVYNPIVGGANSRDKIRQCSAVSTLLDFAEQNLEWIKASALDVHLAAFLVLYDGNAFNVNGNTNRMLTGIASDGEDSNAEKCVDRLLARICGVLQKLDNSYSLVSRNLMRVKSDRLRIKKFDSITADDIDEIVADMPVLNSDKPIHATDIAGAWTFSPAACNCFSSLLVKGGPAWSRTRELKSLLETMFSWGEVISGYYYVTDSVWYYHYMCQLMKCLSDVGAVKGIAPPAYANRLYAYFASCVSPYLATKEGVSLFKYHLIPLLGLAGRILPYRELVNSDLGDTVVKSIRNLLKSNRHIIECLTPENTAGKCAMLDSLVALLNYDRAGMGGKLLANRVAMIILGDPNAVADDLRSRAQSVPGWEILKPYCDSLAPSYSRDCVADDVDG